MAITQQIQQFPPAPNSQTDTPREFNSKADAFVHHQSDTYVTEVNTWATQANALEGEMNTIKTDIDHIVGTIPAGTINDSVTAADKVWSSQKTSDDIALLIPESIPTSLDRYGTKFPDGTMILWGTVTAPAYSDAGSTLNLLKAFVDTNYSITASPATIGSQATTGSTSIEVHIKNSSQVLVKLVTSTGVGAGGGSYKISYQAIGRWK